MTAKNSRKVFYGHANMPIPEPLMRFLMPVIADFISVICY